MKLERVILKNFGCFDRSDFDLDAGLNLVYGPNFSGKTTLVNAIFFALTGKPMILKATAEDLTQAGHLSGTVGLTFSHHAEKYQLFRSTKGDVQLRKFEDGQWRIEVSGKRSAEAQIHQMLQLNLNLLSTASFLREGEIFEFLTKSSTDRRDVLYSILGVDRLIEVRDLFIEARKMSKREERRISQYQKSLKISDVSNRKEEIEKTKSDILKLEQEYEALSAKSSESGSLQLFEELEKTRTNLFEKQKKLQGERQNLIGGFRDLAHIDQTIGEVKSMLGYHSELSQKRDELLSQIGVTSGKVGELESEIAALSSLLEGNRAVCPTCQQQVDFDLLSDIVKRRGVELEAQRTQMEKLNSSLAQRNSEIQAFQKLVERQKTLTQNREELVKVESELSSVSEELKEVESRTQALRGLENFQDSAANAQRRRYLKAQLESLRAQLIKLNADQALVDRSIAEVKKVESDSKRATRERVRFEFACDSIEKTIAAIFAEILQPAEDQIRSMLDRFGLFSEASIDIHSRHLLPILSFDGGQRDLSTLSGSEKMMLYLCLKSALAVAVGGVGFFAFDDPTLHLDDERKLLMLNFIKGLAKDHQTILTTNDEGLLAQLDDAKLIKVKSDGRPQ